MPDELNVAKQAAAAGGEVIARYFRQGVEIRSKGRSDLVTDADVESEKAIVEAIRQSFPDHQFLGEETHHGDSGAEHLWIIDPLDGTTNFAHGIPHFAISVAYYRAGKPQVGVVFNPFRDEWFTAAAGQGAFADGERVGVSQSQSLSEVLVGVGFYYDRGAMMQSTLAAIGKLFGEHIHGIRRMGTASLDLCQVGCGLFGAFFEYELSPWDFAAGRLFVEEAGGRVTTARGEQLPLAKTSVLASNGYLHQSVLGIVQPLHPE